MAASPKRRTATKPGSGSMSAKPADAAAQVEAQVSEVPAPELVFPEMKVPELVTRASDRPLPHADVPPARPADPGAALVDAQIRTLADLCAALDSKCLDLLEDVAAARNAHAATERELAELRQARQGLLADLRETHERELAEARRTQAMLERELSALRLVLERTNRPSLSGADKPNRQRPNGEADAARLLRLLEASLAAGSVLPVPSTADALARFGAAGMVDAIEGTRDQPTCRGWLVSRRDLEAEPLIFLLDDTGMLGWTDANRERLDVNNAHPNTKPRPGFLAPLPRPPVGRLRGIVAIDQADSAAPIFFEASGKAIPEGLFRDPAS